MMVDHDGDERLSCNCCGKRFYREELTADGYCSLECDPVGRDGLVEDVRHILAARAARRTSEGLLEKLERLMEWVVECRERDMAEYRRIVGEIGRAMKDIGGG